MKVKKFTLFSDSAQSVNVQFYADQQSLERISLNREGAIWSAEIQVPEGATSYSFFVDEIEVLDPNAKQIDAPRIWGQGSSKRAKLAEAAEFDWQGIEKPRLHLSQLIIYEMHVRGFTQDPSSGVSAPGTYAGIIEKIPYLKDLGITAVELMPIFEFDETAYQAKSPLDGSQLYNFWGYAPLSFFSPMARYAKSDDPTREFKELVRELHRAGIEVILDVVYNHSDSFLEIDQKSYYVFDEAGNFHNASGCGNTLNVNQGPAKELILDSLHYFANEFQVDGFRFDLASCLTRDGNGHPMAKPPLIEAIENDPKLQEVKFFAEPWDAGGLYQVGSFPGGSRWSEWNGRYRDVVRRFLKGTDGQLSSFAGCFCGSEEIYEAQGTPLCSINFITAHDGFSLHDLFCYNEKHNWANGENNRDGSDYNESWNCGEEGETQDPEILRLRKRQMRNAMVILFSSLGVPLMVSGDEFGQTHQGNNNPWCQDNKLTHLLWNESSFTSFVKSLIALRKTYPALRKTIFYQTDEVHWHGTIPHSMEWGKEGRFLALTIKDLEKGSSLYFAFNACYKDLDVTIPPPPEGQKWLRLIDTKQDLQTEEEALNQYKICAHSSLVLCSQIC
ncbi:MAG: alpha-amylase family glycosyl hydrolase [Candidatus Algichlamydia australiensis]|nr:alpha-amylase family glycosyl hydrolase [Chlamydiales bacterium]